ncbi:MAG: peptide-methionine (S)-S-oxide reductase MsrA [Clostridia bacterium]|nr:peptide-methionine (S)-S-oxide reductase MsrA [Clostridia bacterium]
MRSPSPRAGGPRGAGRFSGAVRRKRGKRVKEAYFAGGCFWCVTPSFRDAPGVTGVTSGYSGGEEADPTYEAVKSQRTGHRETVRVTYDESLTSFQALFDLFLESVDPFDGGGQYIDRGRSYTLAAYYGNEEERTCAEKALRKLEAASGRTPAVALEPFRAFYEVEEYHQDYDLKNPEAFEKELRESGRLSPKEREDAR